MKCTFPYCLREPKWTATFEFRAHDNTEPTPWTYGEPFCDFHKDTCHPSDMFDPSSFAIVEATMLKAGREKPKLNLTTIVWKRLTTPSSTK